MRPLSGIQEIHKIPYFARKLINYTRCYSCYNPTVTLVRLLLRASRTLNDESIVDAILAEAAPDLYFWSSAEICGRTRPCPRVRACTRTPILYAESDPVRDSAPVRQPGPRTQISPCTTGAASGPRPGATAAVHGRAAPPPCCAQEDRDP